MRPKTTNNQKAEIIYLFHTLADNRITTIAERLDLGLQTVNNTLNDFFKRKEKFIIFESKMNCEL